MQWFWRRQRFLLPGGCLQTGAAWLGVINHPGAPQSHQHHPTLLFARGAEHYPNSIWLTFKSQEIHTPLLPSRFSEALIPNMLESELDSVFPVSWKVATGKAGKTNSGRRHGHIAALP